MRLEDEIKHARDALDIDSHVPDDQVVRWMVQQIIDLRYKAYGSPHAPESTEEDEDRVQLPAELEKRLRQLEIRFGEMSAKTPKTESEE